MLFSTSSSLFFENIARNTNQTVRIIFCLLFFLTVEMSVQILCDFQTLAFAGNEAWSDAFGQPESNKSKALPNAGGQSWETIISPEMSEEKPTLKKISTHSGADPDEILGSKSVVNKTGEELVQEFQASYKKQASKEVKERLAIKISTDYDARLILKKNEYKNTLGKRYHNLMKGENGKGGVLKRVITTAKEEMKGLKGENGKPLFPETVLNKIGLIQNEASLKAKKAPMDFDIGVKLDVSNFDKTKAFLDSMGGTAGVDKFHKELQTALEKAYVDLAKSKNINLNDHALKRVFLTATTPFHEEAYLSTEILKAGGLPQTGLIQQAADVSKLKIYECEKFVKDGVLTSAQAYTEATRGTLKDLDKVNRLRNYIKTLGGGKKGEFWTKTQKEGIELLKGLEKGDFDPFEVAAKIKKLTTSKANPNGKTIYNFCNELMDKGLEGTMRLCQPKLIKARFYHAYIDNKKLRNTIVEALASNQKLSDEAARKVKKLDKMLTEIAGVHLVTLEDLSTTELLKKMKSEIERFDSLKLQADAVSPIDQMLARLHTFPDENMAIFYSVDADKVRKVAKKVTPEVKIKLTTRITKGKLDLKKVDRKTYTFLNKLSKRELAIDSVFGLAFAYYETTQISARNDLSAKEKNLLIGNAWVGAIPIIGELSNAIINAEESYFEGDRGKAAQSVLYLCIAVGYFVPQAQTIALVGSLTMMAVPVLGNLAQVQEETILIENWIDSGTWSESGEMISLFDINGLGRRVPPNKNAFKWLIEEGGVDYYARREKRSDRPQKTIRESVLDYAELNLIKYDEHSQNLKAFITNAYPEFALEENLREHVNTGRVQLQTHMNGQKGGSQPVFRAAFVRLKNLYDKRVQEALEQLKNIAEKEYQARHNKAAVKEVFLKLKVLGKRLALPLVEMVNQAYSGSWSWMVENIQGVFLLSWQSIPGRRLQLAEEYLVFYLEIEKSMQKILKYYHEMGLLTYKFADLNLNLTGDLAIDKELHIDVLAEKSYPEAIAEVKEKVEALAKRAGLTACSFAPEDYCCGKLFRELLEIKFFLVRNLGLRDLLDDLANYKADVEKKREVIRKEVQADTDAQKALAEESWKKLWSALESAQASEFVPDVIKQISSEVQEIAAQELKYKRLCDNGVETLLTCSEISPVKLVMIDFDRDWNRGDNPKKDRLRCRFACPNQTAAKIVYNNKSVFSEFTTTNGWFEYKNADGKFIRSKEGKDGDNFTTRELSSWYWCCKVDAKKQVTSKITAKLVRGGEKLVYGFCEMPVPLEKLDGYPGFYLHIIDGIAKPAGFVKHGKFDVKTSYYERAKGEYLFGKLNGDCTSINSEGKTGGGGYVHGRREGVHVSHPDKGWKRSITYKNHRMDGSYKEYLNGNLVCERNYKRGVLDGLCTEYYSSGQPDSSVKEYEAYYTNGIITSSVKEFGKVDTGGLMVVAEGPVKDGCSTKDIGTAVGQSKCGRWKYWDEKESKYKIRQHGSCR